MRGGAEVGDVDQRPLVLGAVPSRTLAGSSKGCLLSRSSTTPMLDLSCCTLATIYNAGT